MTQSQLPIEQIHKSQIAKANLPTMYDLPSEDLEESGLPDEFHDLQPQLLSATLRLSNVASNQIFTGTDLNLYYDINHPLWHKRPDWFVGVGVPRLYDGRDLRLSYVLWQEEVSPTVIVELLSPGTEKEDLGQTESLDGEPPTKWEVYERILQVPYYVLYDRYSDTLRGYQLHEGRYQPIPIETNCIIWVPEFNLGLSLWQGEYQGITRQWLRWIDHSENWIPSPLEQSEQQRQQIEQQRQQLEAKAARLAEKLRELGIDPDDI